MKRDNSQITYEVLKRGNIKVKLGGKTVGTIQLISGYQYFPLKSKEGEDIFTTLEGCQKSLEDGE